MLSVPWFPQGTVPDGPGHLFVMFLVAFVQVTQNIKKLPNNRIQRNFQGVLATYWFSAGIEDFSAADVWTLKYWNLANRNKSRSMMESLLSHPPPAALQHKDSNAQESERWQRHRPQDSLALVQRGHKAGETRLFWDLDFRWVRVQDARSSSHWPKRTSISGTWKRRGC